MSKDYYNILGVAKNASKDDVKKAYRKLAHKYHPDKKGGDERKFKEINEAYYVLGNEQRRAEYDRYGRVFSGAGGGSTQGFDGFSGFDFSNFSSGFSNISDIFEEFFGGGMGTSRKKRGRDISIDIEISFEESVFGTTRKVILTKPATCEKCRGNGADKDATLKTCDKCQGNGKVHETQNSFFGSFATTQVCKNCHGEGKIPSKKCRTCKGEGVVKKEEEIKINIPAGIRDGEMIKLSGKGEAISHGVPGDLYIKTHVKKHPTLKREGNNLVMELNVPLSQALLGDEKEIETLDGKLKIKIPEGTNYGEMLRVRGKGAPGPDGKRGDLLIIVLVKIPKNLSRRAKKMIEELKNEGI